MFGGEYPARRQQARFHRIGQPVGLFVGRHPNVQRHNAGGREQPHLFPTPVVIAITAVFVVPQEAVHGRAAVIRFLAKCSFGLFIAFCGGDVGDSAFQLKQERIQIDRDKLRGANAGETPGIAQPAGGVVPARRRACPQIPIDFVWWSPRMFGRFHVFYPGLVTRRVAVVPVAVEQRAVRHAHHVAIGLIQHQRFRAIHPEGVLHQQVVQITFRPAHAVLFEQLNHQGKDRRLRAAEIIGAIPVRNMAVTFNHPRKVVGHTFEQVVAPTLRQPEHGEIGVPVVGLAKTPAGDDVRLWQRQQGRPRNMVLRLARQHWPQIINVLFQRKTRVGDILSGQRLGHPEVVFDKALQVEIPVASHLTVANKDIERIHFRRAVGEGFAISKQTRRLNVFKEF
ncbi:hypothetical protein D3C72_1119570 [compost metagenome]